MHSDIVREEADLDRLKVFGVTYCHDRLIKAGNTTGQIVNAEIEELESLADLLEGVKPCTIT